MEFFVFDENRYIHVLNMQSVWCNYEIYVAKELCYNDIVQNKLYECRNSFEAFYEKLYSISDCNKFMTWVDLDIERVKYKKEKDALYEECIKIIDDINKDLSPYLWTCICHRLHFDFILNKEQSESNMKKILDTIYYGERSY